MLKSSPLGNYNSIALFAAASTIATGVRYCDGNNRIYRINNSYLGRLNSHPEGLCKGSQALTSAVLNKEGR
jgi:hypothetical protein